MKILLAINSLSSGGAEVFVTQLAYTFKKKGHDVSIITYAGVLDKKGEYLHNKLIDKNITIFNFSEKSRLLLLYYYFKTIQKLKPDIIHSNLEQSDCLVAASSILLRSKKVRTLHNVKIWKTIPSICHKVLFGVYDHNVACSLYTKSHYELKSCRNQLKHINNGIDLNILSSITPKRETLLTRIGIDPNKVIFCVIGTLKKRFDEFQKGHDLIFNAVSAIERDDFEILFLGDCSSIKNDFRTDTITDKRFHFLGIVSQPLSYLHISDVLLAPSRFEGLPISTIEGVCVGLPLICSNIEGFSPFQNDSTVTVQVNNINSLKEGVLYMLDHIDEYKKKAKTLRNHYKTQFDIEKMADKYLQLYQE